MTRNEQFDDLRKQLVLGLHRLEAEGRGLDDAGAELIKAGAILSVATLGLAETIQGLKAQLQQLEKLYADDFPAVKGHG
ncbi:MAG: hypothetical protein AB7F09_15825 [Parvibaculaceae bacterium]